jgi:hypothetical protein
MSWAPAGFDPCCQGDFAPTSGIRRRSRWAAPQNGRLVLDGRAISRPLSIEARSLLWSDDGTRLAAQELVSLREPFSTRVVVFDTRERSTIASSSPRAGIADPLRFEQDVLVYRHWHHTAGEHELRLTIDATTT